MSRFPGSAAGPRTGPVWFFALSPAGCPLMRGVKCLPALVYRPPLLDFDTSLGFAVKASLHHVWLGLACFREFGAGPCRLEDWSPGTLEMCHVRTSREAAPLPEGRPYDHYAEIVIVLEGQVPTVRRLLLGHGLSVSSDGAAYPSPGDAMANFAGSVDRVSFFGAGILAQAWGGLAD